MKNTIEDGGPAFPHPGTWSPVTGEAYHAPEGGMTLRDYFAGQVHADDRLVKFVRAMDDTALILFATNPGVEREEWIAETGDLNGANLFCGKSEVEKVTVRQTLEAKAIAKVSYMQADAMIAERNRKGG